MDKLPDLPTSLITPSSQETDLLESSKQEFRALILQTIDEIKQRFANVTSQTVQTLTQSFHQEIIAQADSILSHSTKPIDCSPIKKFLETLQNSIQSLERLVFLSRYFNPENDSAFLKTLTLKSSQLTNIIFNFNTFMNWWIKALLDNTSLDPKDLLAMLLDSKEKGIHAISTNLLTAKVPQQPAGGYSKLNASIIMDHYYLKSTFGNIKKLCEDFTQNQVPEKVQKMIDSFGESASLSSPALIEFGESFSQTNPVVLELRKELERLEKAETNIESVEFLYDPKEKLDEVIKEVEKYEEEIRTASTKYITQTIARHEGQQDNDSVPIEDLSEIILQEMMNLCILKKETLQEFLKNWENEAKSEILRLFGRQRDMLQDHIGHYIEERLVTFHQGKGDFANASIVKYIQDFCVSASKEYKKALSTKIEQEYEVWPLYFCYVAQNLCDFYLVEYTADSSVLRVYLTAAPMLSTLYKHLSKLDMQKIGKKNVLVTVLNYYDKDISLEFRQVFINPDQIIFDQTKQSKIPQGLKDLIYITIFLLYNTPASQPSSEIHLTSKDFAAFFNYTADYHSVYQQLTGKVHHNAKLITPIKVQTTPNLGHASPGSPLSSPGDFSPGYSAGLGSAWKVSPAMFDFRAPFIDLKQEKNNGFLVHIKGEAFYENSVVVRRNIAQQYSDMLQFKPLGVDGNESGNMDNEVLRYMKRNEKKAGFNFDGVEYLQGYIKRKKEGAGLVKVIGKKESQRIYNLYRTEGKQEILKGLTVYNKYNRVFLIFGYHTEMAPGFMISMDRTKNLITIFKHQRSSTPEDEEFVNFAVFFSEILGFNHPKVNHIKCKIGDETILKYLKEHYFPFTILLNIKITPSADILDSQHSPIDIKLTEQDLVDSFKDFLTLSITANNLEVFKACNVTLEERANNSFRIMNLGTALKFDRLKSILSTLVEKIVLDRVQNTLISFNLLGATGNKTYYMYLYESADQGNNGEATSPGSSMVPGGRLRYIVDVFTLDNNLEFDDKEVLVVVAHMSQVLMTCQLILNGAYILNSRDNILLYNQPDLVISTLRYLVFVGNIPLEKAFQRVAKSFISHYEILDGILNQVSLVSQAPLLALKHRSLSAPQGSETFDFNQAKLHDPQEKAILIKAALQKKTMISDWLFEDLAQGIEFYKGMQAKDIELLQTEEAKYYCEGLDILTFINVLNYEETTGAFLFLVDEQVMKKLLNNDETVLRNVSKFLIEEVTASKTKYEETLDVKYTGTELYFLVSQSLFQSSKVFLIKYNVEKAQSTFYYVQEVPELQQANILQEEISEITGNTGGNVETMKSSERHGAGVLSNLDTVQSKDNEAMSDSSRVIASGRETAVDEEEEIVPKELRKLMENFNAVVTKGKKEKKRSGARYVELEFSEEIRKTMKVQYGLIVKFMVYYLSHKGGYIGEKRLEIKGCELNGFLCDYADKLFYGYVEGSRIKDNYKSLCNTFLDKSNPLGKKSCLVTFLNGKATVEQIGILDNCIKSFKQDFQKIHGIEHGFFCFRIAVGQAVKSFMMHLSGKGKKNLVLTIYNNGSESDDGVIEKLLRTYCMEDAATGSEDILISKVNVYNLNMVNTLFWGYLELTTFLMANEAANEIENIEEYCAKLAYSPLEYLKDLKEFEDKCEKLGILIEMQRTVSQISYVSQMSPS